MRVIFSKYAKFELDDAITFYESEYKGLGLQFKEAVRKTTIRLSEYPLKHGQSNMVK